MKNKDFDFISKKLESENISAPEALSEENIKAKIEEGTSADKIVKFPKNNKRFFNTAVSIAAAIALVVVSLTAVNHYGSKVDEVKPSNNTGITQSNEDILYFSSYDEIDELLKERLPEEEKYYFGKGLVKSESAMEATDSANTADGAAPSHSETYKQVETVDEADIVKTDGEYIYFKSSDEKVEIASAKNGKTERASTINLKGTKYIQELFVKENSLVILSTEDNFSKKAGLVSKTYVSVFDISDKSKPDLKYEYSQSGRYISSRMIGKYVYLISNTSSYYYYKNECIPCCTGEDGEFKELPVEDICAIKESNEGSYTVVGALDITNGSKAKKTKAVIGSANDVYCNENNLYIAGANYSNAFYYNGIYSPESTIIKYSLDKTNIKLVATGRVKGNINNQFSMDEKDGYFRIATTSVNKEGKDINVLYVLDKKLDEVGRVRGFAKNEHIEAVKYIGDMAYVITYEQTDPLFIIDLSDPENPEILGEVKITGFSTLLVPIDEKTLLGIGYSTEENEFGEATNGLKLALFDIGNPASPKVIDEKELEGCDSSAQYSHKALTQNKEKGYLAIPASFYEELEQEDYYYKEGALVFRAQNGKIKIDKAFKSDKLDEADRCVYINNYIYVVDTFSGNIDSFEF